jgi:hypothetical protein
MWGARSLSDRLPKTCQ